MNQRYKTILMWALYAALFLFVMLLQTVVFGRMRFFEVKLNLLPVLMVCVSLWTGHEAGGVFGLAAGLVWACTGADDGSLAIVSITLMGILAGWLCDAVFSRRFFPALFLSLAAGLLHALLLFFLKFYLEGAVWSLLWWAPVTAALSALSVPVISLLAKAIGKVGGN